MPRLPLLRTLLVLLATALPAAAQAGPKLFQGPKAPDLQQLDLPALPKLQLFSPRDTLVFSDRFEVSPALADYPPQATAGLLVDATLPATSTGTGFGEPIQYQEPPGWDPAAGPVPLLVAYHGFGSSAASVSGQTTLDEWCAAEGWFYLSVTGIDDKLFGAPVAQQNVEAAIQWMLDTYPVDPDRIYLVGFSMGGGVAANFAARHRDPDGLMIAAVATVCGSFDWTMTYYLDPSVQAWLINPYNFGASPAADPFAYQQASTLHFDPASYPPVPGNLLPLVSMAVNLAPTPTYMTWDTGDTLAELPAQNAALASLLTGQGTAVTQAVVTGTTAADGSTPATHSWAVLDEQALFAFLEGRSAERAPASLAALADRSETIGWTGVAQDLTGTFSRLAAVADPASGTLTLSGLENADQATLDLRHTDLAGTWPVRVLASRADGQTGTLWVADDTQAAGYLRDTATGELVAGLEWDPTAGAVGAELGPAGLDVQAFAGHWRAALTIEPDPVPRGADFQLALDGPAGTTSVWLVFSLGEAVLTLPSGAVLIASPLPPAILVPLPVDAQGDLQATGTMPDLEELAGARLLFQGALLTSGAGLTTLTNPVALDVE